VDTDLYHDFLTHTGGPAFIELMPAGTNYRDRNARILDYTDELIAVADHSEDHALSRRSGTWMTIRMALKLGIPTHVLILHEETP
jgi:hypothetical protein